MKAQKNPIIKEDIQRYKKNKTAGALALLGIVFCCAYFIVLYRQVKNGNYYYKWPIALDVIYNLIFMLFIFLFSERVKNYERKALWAEVGLGAMQIVRIFWLPLAGVTQTIYPTLAGVPYNGAVLSATTFILLTVFLSLSGACVIASAIFGYARSISLERYNKKLASGEIDIDSVLKGLDKSASCDGAKEEANA